MTFGAWVSLIKDIVLVVAVGFILWFVTHAEHNSDELKSIKATLTETQQWQKEQSDASAKANTAVGALNDHLNAIDARGPVVVRIPVPAAPGAASAAGHAPADTAGSGQGSCGAVRSVDIRPVLESVERKYATALIECQRVIDSWPK